MNKLILALLLCLGVSCSTYAAPVVMIPRHYHHSNDSNDGEFNMNLTGCIIKIYNFDGSVKAEGVAEAYKGKNGFAIVTIKGQEYIVSTANSNIEITEENKRIRAEQEERTAFWFAGFLIATVGVVGWLVYKIRNDW